LTAKSKLHHGKTKLTAVRCQRLKGKIVQRNKRGLELFRRPRYVCVKEFVQCSKSDRVWGDQSTLARIEIRTQRGVTMMKGIEDFQKLGQTNLDAAMKVFGEFSKGWQAIAAEFSDYTKRSFEDGTQTLEKLMGAKSLEQAVDIQSKFVKRSYDEYMHQMAKVGSMYAELAKEAYRPMEKMLQGGR
jgi:hypothetical protein